MTADAATRGLLLLRSMAGRHAEILKQFARPAGDRHAVRPILVPEDPADKLDTADLQAIHGMFYSTEIVLDELRREQFADIARHAPNLQWVHMASTGANRPIFRELADRGVTITNSTGVAAEPIAQTVLGGILALNRGFNRWFASQHRRTWERLPNDAPELRGQTMVLLGLGTINQWVARFVAPLGMHLIGVRRSPAGVEDGVDEWAPPERLHEVLPRANWLVIAVPLTHSTHGLIDAKALSALPPGAHVVNVARGDVVSESALIAALQSGHLGGAYLDVFHEEPLPPSSPLWMLPNVIVSPHNATRSAGNPARVDAIFREELTRWLNGEASPRAITVE